jgi:hypothetical protein
MKGISTCLHEASADQMVNDICFSVRRGWPFLNLQGAGPCRWLATLESPMSSGQYVDGVSFVTSWIRSRPQALLKSFLGTILKARSFQMHVSAKSSQWTRLPQCASPSPGLLKAFAASWRAAYKRSSHRRLASFE